MPETGHYNFCDNFRTLSVFWTFHITVVITQCDVKLNKCYFYARSLICLFELFKKVTADVHEAEVVDSKGCSSLIPDVPAPCSTTCEVKEEAVEQPQDQVEEKEPELPTRPSRVSFTQGEKNEGES